jgi:hypothetical protein
MKYAFKALAAAITVLGASGAQAVTDDFNRPALGPDWVIQAGSMATNGATVSGASTSLMTYTPGAGQSSASVDILLTGATETQYGAIVLGYQDVSDNAFIKLQNNGSVSGFDTIGFYYGNNGGGSFQSITGFESVTSARITGTLTGTVATLAIDSNFDGIAEQTLSYDYGSGTVFGTGVGLGIYGPAQLDNFTVGAVPEPETYALMLAGLACVAGVARRRVKHG